MVAPDDGIGVVSVPSQRDAARILRYRLTRVIVSPPVVCAYARESVQSGGSTSSPREG